MTRSGPAPEEPRPPAWAEALLRALLEPRSRDTVTGDLLEEFREEIVPKRGLVSARLWYLRQVVSFASPGQLAWVVRSRGGEADMSNRLTGASVLYLVAGVSAIVLLLTLLVRSNFGPPVGLGVFIGVGVMLAAMGVLSVRTRADIESLVRAGLFCAGLVAVVLIVRTAVEVLNPVDPVERFLAQARDGYSEFDYPRRWLPAVSIGAILMATGLVAAWRTGRIGGGTLASMLGAGLGSLVYAILVMLANLLPMGPQDPLGDTPSQLQYFGNVPTMLVPMMILFSTVLGSVGGVFGRAFASSRAGRGKAVQGG